MEIISRLMSRNGSVVGAEPWVPDPKTKWQFDIDIVGSCNLRCPSCPVGNSRNTHTPTRYMRRDLMDKIVRKATSECHVTGIYLYNWTEPFLHPRLAEMIEVVQSYGVPCGLSSNLNLINNLEDVLAANPSVLKVSLSGFNQETYGVTHQRGDIELVKRNMAEVARLKTKTNATTRLVVAFHRYLGNHDDEALMKAYSESLGFEFEPAWAYFMPLEKMLAFTGDKSNGTHLTDEDLNVINRLALPLDAAITAARKNRHQPCILQRRQMAITSQGDVMLCCTVFDQKKNKLAPFLDTPLIALQRMKYHHDTCARCMNNGLHVYFVYGSDDFDALALERVATYCPEAKIKGVRQLQSERQPRGILGLPRRARNSFKKLRTRLIGQSD